jgi:Tol biopolymer transport system component
MTRLHLELVALAAVTLVVGLVLWLTVGRSAAPARYLSDASALYVVGEGGGTPRMLLRPPSADSADESSDAEAGQGEKEGQIDTPTYSPDGREIAYTQTTCEYCESKLHIAPANAPGRSHELERVRNPYQASWSPDGRRLVVLQPGAGIAIVDARTGASRTIVKKGSRSIEAPAWSPTGDRILFTEQEDATNWDVYVVEARGGRPARLTTTAAQETGPTWSPDGHRIAFSRADRDGTWRVYTQRATGGPATPVTPRGTSAVEPAWSPDGRRLAVTTQVGDDSSIRVLTPGGGRLVRITPPNLFATQPAWSADGRRLIFIARGLEAPTGPAD